MKMSGEPQEHKEALWYRLAKHIAMVAGIFAVILSVLLIVHFIQTKTVDPLNSKALSQLMLQLQDNPEDTALKEQIRALDLLARKAYFTFQWQIRTGSRLLFALVLVFLIGMKYMSSLQRQYPDLTEDPDREESWEMKLMARRYLLFGGLGFFILALILGILSETELKTIGSTKGEERTSQKDRNLDEIRRQWPNFRGPEGIGVAYHTDVPFQWNGTTDENILWKLRIPKSGFNSPIIWDKKIFLSGADRNSQEIYCVDAESGTILWQVQANDIPGSPSKRPEVSGDTGYAASTLTTDGKRVIAIFATGDMICVDFEGNRVWAKNIGVPDNHYGHSSSLIIYRDLVLIQYDQNIGGRLMALRIETGEPAYDTSRDVQISWASPILVDTDRGAQIVLNSNPFVIAYDPDTGKELWRVSGMMGEVAPSPAYADGMVYAVNEYARLLGIGLGDSTEVVWEFDEELSEVSSLLATGDYLIMAASYGTVSCLNSKTGERFWYHDFDDGFYSSPILVDDNVFLMDMTGKMVIFKADKEFQLVGECVLGENAVTIPAFMHNRIYIRGERHLFCIGK